MTHSKKIDWIHGILSLTIFMTFIPGLIRLFLLIRLTYKTIIHVPNYEKKELKIEYLKYKSSRNSNGRPTSVYGYGTIINDSISVKVRLEKTTKFTGIHIDSVKYYLLTHDSIVPIWSTPNGESTSFRHEIDGEPFNWREHYNQTLIVCVIGIFVFIIPYYIRNKRSIAKM